MLHRFAASDAGQGITLGAALGLLGLLLLAYAGPMLGSLFRSGVQGRPVPEHLQVRRRWKAPHSRSATPEPSARSGSGRASIAGRRVIHRRRGSPSIWDTWSRRRTARR
ncbi:MAG: hypothetical protein KDB37_15770 [Ilumatobacter sp.]|nr:hypothetical protein [Ilumatobacter sp.]